VQLIIPFEVAALEQGNPCPEFGYIEQKDAKDALCAPIAIATYAPYALRQEAHAHLVLIASNATLPLNLKFRRANSHPSMMT
jgi:hypothetical protein